MAPISKMERHPQSVPGDFYVQNGECTACGVPEMVAPDFIGRTDEHYWHCYWKKQPQTALEMEQAFRIFDGQDLGCHRYAGTDPEVQARVGFDQCDYPIKSKLFYSSTTVRPPEPNFALLDEPGWLQSLFRKLLKRK